MSCREYERVKVDQKSSKALGTHAENDFKAVICVSLTRDNEVTIEDVELAENTFGPDSGRLKGNTTRSKPLLTQSRAIGITRELLHLHEEVEMCLDTSYVSGKLLETSISHEMHHRESIPRDGMEKKKHHEESRQRISSLLQIQI